MSSTFAAVGRFGSDPETISTKTGTLITSFSFAVPHRFGKDVSWVRVKTFSQKTGNFIGQYFKKGSQAFITGELQVRDWKAADGKKGTSVEVLLDAINFAGSGGGNQKGADDHPTKGWQGSEQVDAGGSVDDDLPF